MNTPGPVPYPDRNLAPVPDRPRTTWTADELMAVSFPESTWAVPGIIAEGLSVLAGYVLLALLSPDSGCLSCRR